MAWLITRLSSPLQHFTGFSRCASGSARAPDSLKGAIKAQAQRRATAKPRKGDPLFRDVWRRFTLKVHPDLFGQFPILQAANSESLQKLQGLLNEVKSGERTVEERLRGRTEKLEFFIRAPSSSAAAASTSAFSRLPVTIRIPDGGHCPESLAIEIGEMFSACGLPGRFHWGTEYWQSTYTVPPERPQDGEDN